MGDLLTVWFSTAFCILAKPLHLRSMLSKLLRCTKNQMPAVRIGQQNGPSSSPQQCMLYNQHFKSCTNWAMQFCLICHIHLTSHQPVFTSSSTSTTFCLQNASTTSRRQKMLSKSLLNPEAQLLPRCRNKQTYFSVAKMCWLSWFLFWFIKMCLCLLRMI